MPRGPGGGGRGRHGGRHGGRHHGGRHRGHGFSGRIGPVRYRFKGFRKRIHQHTLRFTVKGIDVALGGKVDLENRQIKGGHLGLGYRGAHLNVTQGTPTQGHRIGGSYRALEVSHITGSGKTLVHLGPFEGELSRNADGTVNLDIAQEPLRQYAAELLRDWSFQAIAEKAVVALQAKIEEKLQAQNAAEAERMFQSWQGLVQESLEGARAATDFALRSAHLAATAGPADLALGAEHAAFARLAAETAAAHATESAMGLAGMGTSAVLFPIEHETAVAALDLGITQATAARALAAEAAEAAESVLLFLL